MKKKEMDLGDFHKIELLLGLSEGDEFQVNGHLNHLYTYDKKSNKIIDEEGNPIPSELLLQVINDPGCMKNHGSGLNTYELMNSMVGKYFGLSLIFCLIGFCVFIVLKTQMLWTALNIFLLILMIINFCGAGVMAGVLLTKIILNKELFF